MRARPGRAGIGAAGVLAALLTGPAVEASPSSPPYRPGVVACAPADARIGESSGLAVRSGHWWTLNDSGDGPPRVFALDTSCRTVAVVLLNGRSVRDAEDLAPGVDDAGRPALWVADTGDNRGRRPEVRFLRFAVPDLPASGAVGAEADEVAVEAVEFRARYADGPRDAEALLVDPAGGVAVVTKPLLGRPGVYVPTSSLVPEGTAELVRAGGVVLGREPDPADGSAARGPAGPLSASLVTGGAVAPDGSRVALRTYTAVHEWEVAPDERGADGRLDLAAVLGREPDAVVPLPDAPQGEAVAFTADGRDLLVSSEGVGSPVHLLAGRPGVPAAPPAPDRPPGQVTTGEGPQGAPAQPVEAPTRLSVLVVAAVLTGAAFAVGGAVVAVRAKRRRRRNAEVARSLGR